MKNSILLSVLISICFILNSATAQHRAIEEAPKRTRGEGPFNQLIIRGGTYIKGNGSPAIGPVDIVIENNMIKEVVEVGFPGVEIDASKRPSLKEGGKEIDAHGKYILPGFIDMHGHIGGVEQGTPAEYVFKLWMAHGITTIRDPYCGNGLDWVLAHKKRSEANEITAPRIFAYTNFGQNIEKAEPVRRVNDKVAAKDRVLTGPFSDANKAVSWVRANYERGSDGIKFFGAPPKIMKAALQENKRLGLRSACHHAQVNVSWWNVLNSAEAGLTSMEHWYGLPEAMFTDRVVQNYPPDYNYMNEQNRFEEAGKLWQQVAKPFSPKWNQVMNKLLDLDFTIDPTFNIYEANRDLMRAMTLEWHRDYTLPSLWHFFKPDRISHGSYWFHWGTEQEVNWRKNYALWMAFVNEYKNRGGRVTTGSDSGYIYQIYGFGYIRELEMLREAGFHPLEVIRSATLMGAEALGMEDKIGTIEIGKYADLVIIDENPLGNLKVLYGTGAIKLSKTNQIERVGGVLYTIKDGIVFDAKRLLADVRNIVKEAKKGKPLKLPGHPYSKEE